LTAVSIEDVPDAGCSARPLLVVGHRLTKSRSGAGLRRGPIPGL
jgi:hypothetical protein